MRTKSKYDRFPIVKRGYDPETVESHLESLIDENDLTLDEAAAQIASLQTDLEESQKHEEAVHLTILAATKTKEGMLEVAQRQADEARAAGRKQGDGIITDARMQAFQVVTEARQEADDIVAEARTEVGALMRTIEEKAPSADLPSAREIELEIRVEELQGVIADMESELRSRPLVSESDEPADDESETAPDEESTVEAAVIPIDIDSVHEDEEAEGDHDADNSPADHAGTVLEDHVKIVVTDTTPIVPDDDTTAMDDREETDSFENAEDLANSVESDSQDDTRRITDDREADSVRRSFYSRRSAKLPRIGVEAGRGAMAAAAGLRTGITSNEEPNDKPDPDRSQEYETV
ncbi:MAG: DivIVA domain-containing protein [Actinomycetota bacterium]|nr:DivIVA domain-containing protein [Actinomycetota bacterium]